MADEHSAGGGLWCPVCLTPIGDDISHCPACGLPQAGPAPARLRVIVARLHEISVQHAALRTESTALGDERVQLLTELRGPVPALSPTAAPAGPQGKRGAGDWRPERVRDALLWLGTALLALSAVTFAIVAWARLEPAGRAGLLLGATLLTAGIAIAIRHRLRATAEALTGLTLALGLVDWYVLRRAGMDGGTSLPAWWAIGTAVLAGLAVVAARRLELRSARIGAALLGVASGAFLVAATADDWWTGSLGCALVASVVVLGAVVADRGAGWRDVAALLRVAAVGFEIVGLGLVAVAIARIDTTADAIGPAISVLALGLSPAVAVLLDAAARRVPAVNDVLVGLAAAAAIGAPLVLASAELDSGGLAVLAAALGVTAIGWARLGRRRVRLGVAGAGAITMLGALRDRSGDVWLAMIGPLDWLDAPWSGSLRLVADGHFGATSPDALTDAWATVAVLVAGVAAIAVGCGRSRVRPPLVAGLPVVGPMIAGAVVALAVALPAAGASIGVVLGGELLAGVALVGFAVRVEADRPASAFWLLGGAGLLLVPATGWTAVDRGATLTVLAVVAVVAGLAGVHMQANRPRVALITLSACAAVAEVGVAVGVASESLGAAGFATAVAGGAVLVLGAAGRKATPDGPALEAVGMIGLGMGAALSGGSTDWLAAALTVAVPALGVAAWRRHRLGYRVLTPVVTVAAVWAWLLAADVSVLEAYTLSAAGVALGAGLLQRRARADVGSWTAFGPGLVLAIGPSLVVALERGGTARVLGVIAGAVVCVLVGSRRRLRAPLTIGGLALLALAIDGLGPVAAQVPRWVALGVIGLLMLWLGASAERRLHQLRRWRLGLKRLG